MATKALVAIFIGLFLFCLSDLAAASDRVPNRVSNPSSAPTAQQTAALTNADVVRMVRAKLSTDIIVAAIKDAPAKALDLSVMGLLALKEAGVPDDVIRGMQDAGRASAASPVAAKMPTASVAAPPERWAGLPCLNVEKSDKGPSTTRRLLTGGLLFGRGKKQTSETPELKQIENGETATISTNLAASEAVAGLRAFLSCRDLDFTVNAETGRFLTDWFDDRRCGPGFQHCANRANIRVVTEGANTTIRIQVMERKREGGASEKPWHENSESRGKETAQFAAQLELFLASAH